MADKTHIQWTDATWNPLRGCSRVSEGCRNCYAEGVAARFSGPGQPYKGLAHRVGGDPRWTGKVVMAPDDVLTQPLRWKRPRRIFVNSMSDLFHESVPLDVIAQIYGTAVAAVLLNGHVLQILTKRAERMQSMLSDPAFWEAVNAFASGHVMERVDPLNRRSTDARATLQSYARDNPPPGIWLGVSTEDQATADARIPLLLDTPAAVRFISAEPLLGPVDWKRWLPMGRKAFRPGGAAFIADHFYMTKCEHCGWSGSSELCGTDSFGDDSDVFCPACHRSMLGNELPKLDWIICGGESGPKARPMHPDWARSLRDQCQAADVTFFFKQWGEWIPTERDGIDALGQPRSGYTHPEGKQAKWPRPEGLGEHGPKWLEEHGFAHMSRLGKKAAGDLLDGVQHHSWPEVRP